MKTMKNETIIIERTFNAPVDAVWNAITDKDQMKQWYFFQLDDLNLKSVFTLSSMCGMAAKIISTFGK